MAYTFDKEGIAGFRVPDVLVYNMGKVGSTSIAEVIMEKFKGTLKSHWMNYELPIAEFYTDRPYLMGAIYHNEADFKTVIPIREPMSRNISAFWQLLYEYVDGYRKDRTVEELHQIFMDVYNVEFPDQWFRKEPMEVLGFEPYKIPFDCEQGYQIYDDKFLVIRLEDADRVLTKALHEFLGVDGIQMRHSHPRKKVNNLNVEKEYAEFKSLKYPKEFVDRTYALEYVNHFYTPEEIQKFRDKWSE